MYQDVTRKIHVLAGEHLGHDGTKRLYITHFDAISQAELAQITYLWKSCGIGRRCKETR